MPGPTQLKETDFTSTQHYESTHTAWTNINAAADDGVLCALPCVMLHSSPTRKKESKPVKTGELKLTCH